jgi:phenylalanyl-tRNA synthetase beta chain
MLCSAKELGLADEQNGLLELDDLAPVGTNLRVHLDLDDTLFTLKLTPNLAHCLSVVGVARELAALTATPLRLPEVPRIAPTHDHVLPVRITAPDLCGRFSGRVIRHINPLAETPRWMVERLARCGQRSVSPLVDISNYVMFELGQPTHIFDLEKLHGNLTVRWANAGESLKLLNGESVLLDANVGVIADDQCVESLAGIMGGDATAVTDDTRHVYVEAAFWWPKSVAGRSRRYNFSTEAGHRFERGVDPALTVVAIERITSLIQEICGGQSGEIDDQSVNLPKCLPVKLRVARAEQVIGMPLSAEMCSKALRSLGLEVTEAAGELTVIPPSYRFDLQIEEDLIEEVVRVIGYENLPDTPPIAPVFAVVPKEKTRSAFSARRLLAAMGYQETINFSFVDESWESEMAGNRNPIRLLNPIAKHMSVMRSTLLGSLLQVAKFNLDRRADRVAVFEIGRVYLRDKMVEDSDTSVAGVSQPQRVAGLVCGPTHALNWEGNRATAGFYDVKGHVETLLFPRRAVFEPCAHPAFHPGRCAQIRLKGVIVGHVGELHPKLRQSWGFTMTPILFEIEFDAFAEGRVAEFESFNKQQIFERDIAIWVPEAVTHDRLMQVIHSSLSDKHLKSATLFDIYRPALAEQEECGHKSMAVRLFLHQSDGVSDESGVDRCLALLFQNLESVLGARKRA